MARHSRDPLTVPTKGQRTRAAIVEKTAETYNERGFAGLSIATVLALTGLEKGGFYNHFASKDELALAAFDFLVGRLRERFAAALAGETTASGRLVAIANVYDDLAERPFIRGGCPILNTAVEADDTHPALRERARAAMSAWHTLFDRTIRDGVASGEFRRDVEPEEIATVLIAAIEGGILMSKLYGDWSYIRSVAAFVRSYATALGQAAP